MKFIKGEFINSEGQVCVVGALALSQGISKKKLRNEDSDVLPKLADKLGVSERNLDGLIKANDSGRWVRLEQRLRQLELFHLVRPFALDAVKTSKKVLTKSNS